MQAIREKPEFVCTCCHRWLFQKTVMKFDISKYDMTNDIVKETLDIRYHHKMDVAVFKGSWCAHEHPIDFDYSESESDDETTENNSHENTPHNSNTGEPNVTYKTYEYICNTCHNSLKWKKPKMPAQACANGLLLSPIPPELMNLTDLERRIIALRIPFMVIFCMVQYGSQYKIHGSCTNVPSSLDQIVEMLPRMSSEVQFHPMKLKKKMSYKSSYMYNFIWKDVIIGAIKWLKENNQLYNEIQINDSWADDWLNSEFATIVDESNDDTLFINDDIDDDTTDLVSHDTNDDNNELQIEECELIEDQNATDANLQLTGIPTSNVLEFENLENEVYTCAPGENQIPRYMLMDDKFEVLAFPDMFPYGTQG